VMSWWRALRYLRLRSRRSWRSCWPEACTANHLANPRPQKRLRRLGDKLQTGELKEFTVDTGSAP
jgi:hypothetical protein